MNTIADALLLESALDDAKWLSASNREGVLSRLDDSLLRWHETDVRSKTRVEMAHFGSIAELVTAANHLDKLDPRTRATRRTIDEIVVDPVETRSAKVLESRMRSMERIVPAIEAASRIRDIRTTPPPGHLLAARRVLDRVYLRAERAVFEHLPEIIASESALNDPELMGMLIRQGELAQDLQLLRNTDTWQDLVKAHAPGEVKRHTRAIEMLANRLGQPSRRDGARLALDSMERQFEAAIHPPFLGRIRNGDEDAINLTGGRDRELLAAFRSSLQELILDWSDGAPDDGGASRFDLVLRLLDQLETLSVLLEAGGREQLNAWGGWMLAGDSGRIKLSALQSRLKIAIEFLLAGNEKSLRKQLHEFDTQVPFTRLAVRAGAILGDTIRNLPEGISAALAKIAIAPGKDDLLFAYREDLMTLARFTWELQEARSNGEQDQADDIEAYCTALAGMIADDMENRRYILPELDPIDDARTRNMESMNDTR
jgi:hypothetical protein